MNRVSTLFALVLIPSMVMAQEERFGPSSKWRLGVQVRNTNTGVQITNVAPGSPAATAGLQVGDSILCLAGRQVGYIDGRLNDLGDEIDRSVGPLGRVTFLVHRRRDSALVNVPTQLERAGSHVRIQGVVRARRPISIGPASSYTVRVLDVTHPGWGDVVVARQTFPTYGQLPANFSLDLSAAQYRPGHRYEIDAHLHLPNAYWSSARVPLGVPIYGVIRANLILEPNSGWYDSGQWYRQHLNRPPSPREQAAWRERLEAGHTPQEIEAEILGGTEAFERARRNPREFARNIYRSAGNQEPPPELLNRYAEALSRPNTPRDSVVQQILNDARQKR